LETSQLLKGWETSVAAICLHTKANALKDGNFAGARLAIAQRSFGFEVEPRVTMLRLCLRWRTV